MKYFRGSPWRTKLSIFALIWLGSFLVLVLIFPAALSGITGFTATQLAGLNQQSTPALVSTALVVAGIQNLFVFGLPALIFAWLTSRRPLPSLGLVRPGKKGQALLAVLLMLGAMPCLQMLEGLISQVNFGPHIKELQKMNEDMFGAFLNITSVSGLFKVFLFMAIVPAVSEELFFRGALLRLAKRNSRGMVIPIIFTAFLFAAAHGNIYGFISIFACGILLATIYYLTGSLWCNVLAHMFFNGVQVFLAYLGKSNTHVKAFMDNNTVPLFLVIAGLIVFSVSLYLLLKNKTPLASGWAVDDPPAEDTLVIAAQD